MSLQIFKQVELIQTVVLALVMFPKKIAINSLQLKTLLNIFHGRLFSYFPQKRVPKLTTCEELESMSPLKCTCEELESESPLKCKKNSPSNCELKGGVLLSVIIEAMISEALISHRWLSLMT